MYRSIAFAAVLALFAAVPVSAATAAQKAAVAALVALERSQGNRDVEKPSCFVLQAYAHCVFLIGNGNSQLWRLLQLKGGGWTLLGGGGEVTINQGIRKFGSIASMLEKQYDIPASIAKQFAAKW